MCEGVLGVFHRIKKIFLINGLSFYRLIISVQQKIKFILAYYRLLTLIYKSSKGFI